MTRPLLDLFGFPLAGGAATPPRQLRLPLTVSASLVGGCPGGDAPPFRFAVWTGTEGEPMGGITEALRDETDAIGRRWAEALRRRYRGEAAAKTVARAFDVQVRTAEGWLAGQAPYAKYLLRGWRLHGAALVAEVLAPGSDWHASASVEAALVEVETRLAGLGDELARLRVETGR